MFNLLLGHVLGDYFFQTHEMATKKSLKGSEGTKWCLIHTIIYSLCVCICMQFLWIFPGIFLSHYFIDRYSLAYKYIMIKGGPNIDNPFFPIIYVIIDNSTHLILMWIYLTYTGVL